MTRLFGWDLPPGCTQRDIDEACGSDDEEIEMCDHGIGFDEECEDCREETKPSDEELRDHADDQRLHERRDEGRPR